MKTSNPAIDVESPCQACGACCSYSSNWPRFTTEDDAALDLIPEKFVNPAGGMVFTADDVIAGQQVFLKHGLMDNGTIWGHGGYLGPDFSAQSLHILALDLADRIARERLSRGYTDLTPEERAAVEGAVALVLKANRYDPASGTLALPTGAAVPGRCATANSCPNSPWRRRSSTVTAP